MPTRSAVTLASLGLLLTACAPNRNPFREGTRPFLPPDDVQVPYGSQEPEDVTGAISAVSLDENEHVEDVISILRSHVPGLQVIQLPNGDFRLRIRGEQQSLRTDDESNQPLLVIDGMPILPTQVGGALRGLNPRQVESIQVLKDVASTAIYGSRGANGVILIEMKR
jgi:TonB-dependent SusC/RagA subfamily outer membrane receptor